MSEFHSQSELSLQAFRYAAGEMHAAEAEEFEQLLETDLDAQLALVRTVQLGVALQSATSTGRPARVLSDEARVSSRRWSSILALVGSGAVAATLLFALREEPPGPENATVALWNELRDEEIVEPASLDDVVLADAEAETSEEELVPDWMLAVVAMEERAGDGSAPGAVSGDEDFDDETL